MFIIEIAYHNDFLDHGNTNRIFETIIDTGTKKLYIWILLNLLKLVHLKKILLFDFDAEKPLTMGIIDRMKELVLDQN